MSDIRKYINLVESANQLTEADSPKGKLTVQQYQIITTQFEDRYYRLDNGKNRSGTQFHNPQIFNLEYVVNILNDLEPGHFYRSSEVNKSDKATKCFNNVYNVDGRPVLDVVYDRFSGFTVGVYMHAFSSAEEAKARKDEQDQERQNDRKRKINKGEY